MIDCLQTHVLSGLMTDQQAEQAKQALFEMAQTRVHRLTADHPDVEKFWSVFEFLMSTGKFVCHTNINDPSRKIGINLNHFYKVARENYQDLPDITQMKRLLKNSSRYKFVDSNISVMSVIDGFKTMKCWIFTKPND